MRITVLIYAKKDTQSSSNKICKIKLTSLLFNFYSLVTEVTEVTEEIVRLEKFRSNFKSINLFILRFRLYLGFFLFLIQLYFLYSKNDSEYTKFGMKINN